MIDEENAYCKNSRQASAFLCRGSRIVWTRAACMVRRKQARTPMENLADPLQDSRLGIHAPANPGIHSPPVL